MTRPIRQNRMILPDCSVVLLLPFTNKRTHLFVWMPQMYVYLVMRMSAPETNSSPRGSMSPKSIRALTWFSIFLLLLGTFVMSPVVVLLLAIPTIICTLVIIFFGSLIPRIVGLIVLAASVGLAAANYPEASQQMKNYKNHVKKTDISSPSASPHEK